MLKHNVKASKFTRYYCWLGALLPAPSFFSAFVWKTLPFLLIFARIRQRFKFRYAILLCLIFSYTCFLMFIGEQRLISGLGLITCGMLVVLYHRPSNPLLTRNLTNQIFIFFTIFALFYIVIDSNFLRTRVDGRIHLFHIDPNFSSVVVLGLYVLSRFEKMKVWPLVFLMFGLILASRAFILSIFVFEFFLYVPIVKKIRVSTPIILSLLLVLLLSNVISNLLGDFQIDESGARFFNWADNSNIGRFRKFMVVGQLLFDGTLVLKGIDLKFFGSIVPHNSALFLIVNYGLLNSLMFITLFYGMRASTRISVAFVLAFVVFSTFLHGLYLGYFLCIFLIIFNELNRDDIDSYTPQR